MRTRSGPSAALTKAGAIEPLFTRFDQQLRAQGYLAMSGQLVDANIVAAPKQRNTQAEKQTLKEGRVPEDWQSKPTKLRQKDRDARWTVKTTKARPRAGDTPLVDLAIPAFGYQNHISADRRHRLIRRWLVTDAAAHAGAHRPGEREESAVRAHIEHVFAEQKVRMGLVRTIGLARATTKIGLANLVHNMRRLIWLERQPALA